MLRFIPTIWEKGKGGHLKDAPEGAPPAAASVQEGGASASGHNTNPNPKAKGGKKGKKGGKPAGQPAQLAIEDARPGGNEENISKNARKQRKRMARGGL